MDEFSTLDIVKALGIPRERLRDWMTKEFIKPSIAADGQGTWAIFTLQDVYAVALFQSLIRYGLNRKAAGKFVGEFMKVPDHKDASYIILRESIVGKGPARRSIAAVSSEECRINLGMGTMADSQPSATTLKYGDLAHGDKEWQMIHIVNFAALRKEVDAAVAKL